MCQPGYHSHENGNGGWLGCHPIEQKHRDDATQQKHEIALSQTSSSGERIMPADDTKRRQVSDFAQGDFSGFSRKRTNSENAVIQSDSTPAMLLQMMGYDNLIGKDYTQLATTVFSSLARDKAISKIVPLAWAFKSMARMSSTFGKMQTVKATQNEKSGFAKGWKEVDELFDGDLEPDEVEARIQQIREKMDGLSKQPKALKKGTLEHGHYVAMKQFLDGYDRYNSNDMREIIKDLDEHNVNERTRSRFENLSPEQRKALKEIVIARKKDSNADMGDFLTKLPVADRQKVRELYGRYQEIVNGGSKEDAQGFMSDWRAIKRGLSENGLSDDEIAEILGGFKRARTMGRTPNPPSSTPYIM